MESDRFRTTHRNRLTAGSLKAPVKQLQADATYLCEAAIPNKEIASVYKMRFSRIYFRGVFRCVLVGELFCVDFIGIHGLLPPSFAGIMIPAKKE